MYILCSNDHTATYAEYLQGQVIVVPSILHTHSSFPSCYKRCAEPDHILISVYYLQYIHIG